MDDDALAAFYVQCVIDTLERGKPGGRNRAGLLKVEPLGYVRDPFCQDCDILGVEAALRIIKAVCVDPVADLESADARSRGCDSAGATPCPPRSTPRPRRGRAPAANGSTTLRVRRSDRSPPRAWSSV